MKQATIIFAIVILLTGCAGIQKWDKKDQILFGTFAGIHTVDIFQTREIMIDGNGYKELNPILDGLSRDQATAAMIGGYALVYLAAEYIPRWRTEILIGFTALSGVCVINNFNNGFGLKFNF